MMAILRQSVLSLIALVLLGLLGSAQAGTSPIGVALDQRVIDLTNTLDAATTTRLKNQLADLEQRKGSQVAVLLVPTTGAATAVATGSAASTLKGKATKPPSNRFT